MGSLKERTLSFFTGARLIFALLAVDGFSKPAEADDVRKASAGVFTEAQAARGRTLYFDSCSTCHGGALQGEEDSPALAGKHFSSRWGGRPLSGLYGFIDTQMPLGQPGSLGATGTADVVAYILSVNKYPAGTAELPADVKLLRSITVDSIQ